MLSLLASLFAFASCNGNEPEATEQNGAEESKKATDGTDKPTERPTEKPTEKPTERPTEKPTDDGKEPEKTSFKVLFIGNSFTYYNNMPTAYFAKMCKAAGLDVEIDTITNGGHRLDEFADPEDEYGAKVHRALANEQYDYVILQEQSGRPIAKPEGFFDGSRDLAALVAENGAELWFYQTWGYKEGYSKLPTHGGTTEEMELMLRAAYDAIAEELGAKVAHVGIAMYDLHSNKSFEPNLYNSDLFHPSEYGSIVAAWTIFASIFEIDPDKVDFDCGIEEEHLEDIKEAAYYAAFYPDPVPDGYKISSEGVTNKK